MRFFSVLLLSLHFAGAELLLEAASASVSRQDALAPAAATDPACPDDRPGQPCTDNCGLCLCHPALSARPAAQSLKRLPPTPEARRLGSQDVLVAWLLYATVYRPPKSA